jgi:peptide/nickel transport system permease protein
MRLRVEGADEILTSNGGLAANVCLQSPFARTLRSFFKDGMALLGSAGIVIFLLIAIFAPLFANGRPFAAVNNGGAVEFPFFRYIFAPDANEKIVEKFFNFLMLFLPSACLLFIALKRKTICFRWISVLILAIIISLPFFIIKTRLDRTNWKEKSEAEGGFAIFAPIPYNPSDTVAVPYQKPSSKHFFGSDQIGRDVLSRMIYGTRISMAVGISATAIAMIIGIAVGLASGYYGGKVDIALMRMVEIVICFPTFLLLLILMSIMMDRKFEQSVIIVITVIGLTSWTGLSRIVRGEVLQQRQMPYIKSCETLAIPGWRILFMHLLPNVSGPVFVSFTFGIAGAVLAESGLSFLGFGVQPPTASWGELLRQAFADPVTYWHLTLWPGIAIFAVVVSFNFVGEGIRKALNPKE